MRWAHFIGGLVVGIVFSFLYYLALGIVGSNPNLPGSAIGMLGGAIILKFAVGFVLVFRPKWKAFGLGLICSVPLAVLLLVGLCFGLIAVN